MEISLTVFNRTYAPAVPMTYSVHDRTIEDSFRELEEFVMDSSGSGVYTSFDSDMGNRSYDYQPFGVPRVVTPPSSKFGEGFEVRPHQRDSYQQPMTPMDSVKRRKSSVVVPKWVDVPEGSKFFVIKSSRLEHVQSSYYNGIWSSTYFGNKRLTDAFATLDTGTKIFLLFSVTGSGRFCGVAEMISNLEDDLDTSIWEDNNKKYGKAFKVRWILVRDVHNRSLKHFLIPSNEMKPVTNSRDTQEIPFSIGNSILKLFKSDQSNVQSFLDADYS